MTTNCVCGLAQYLEIRTHAHPGACPSAVRVVKKGIRPCGQFQDKIYSGRRTCRSANQCPRLNASSGRQSRKDGQLDDLSQLGEYFKEELEQLQKGDLDELKTESQPSQASSRDAPELTGGYNTNSDDGDFEEGDEIFNLDSGWSVSAFDSDQSLESFSSSFGKIDADDEGAGMAACELLKTLPEHIVRRLEAEQREADAVEENRRQRRSGGGLDTKPKTQRRLRIIGGTAAGIRIHSQVGNLTRPMMEKVRGAIFDALISREGGSSLPAGARWGSTSLPAPALSASRGSRAGAIARTSSSSTGGSSRTCFRPTSSWCGWPAAPRSTRCAPRTSWGGRGASRALPAAPLTTSRCARPTASSPTRSCSPCWTARRCCTTRATSSSSTPTS
uniref:Rrna methyltransferase ylbh n=1 Tax=Tetraselmis sp. GSL018 TaxID=582737 RepID=A0A061R5U3_9CHLO